MGCFVILRHEGSIMGLQEISPLHFIPVEMTATFVI
jgi:hypothetical protein